MAAGRRGGRARRPAARLIRAVLVGGLAWTAVLSAPGARAEPTRFIPWNDTRTPALALRDLKGQPHGLADLRGKVVLVNFWATWCEPCRDEMPSMQRLEASLAGQPFAVLAVNFGESPQRVREFTDRLGLGFRVLLDPDREASRAWRVRVLPSSFLVDADGRVRHAVVGEMDWASREAERMVRALLR